MDVLLLWLCFLAVVAGIALSLAVLVRELRGQVVARRSSAAGDDDAELVLTGPAAPAMAGAPSVPTASPASHHADAARVAALSTQRPPATVPAARRGLGAPGQGSGTPPRRPVSGRGLGSSTPVPPRSGRSTHRGLGRRPHA